MEENVHINKLMRDKKGYYSNIWRYNIQMQEENPHFHLVGIKRNIIPSFWDIISQWGKKTHTDT